MAKELLKMEGITKIYGNGFMANKDITFTVNEGEIHALIGENGAGKTTLMKILFGLENCQQGKIYLDGKEVHIENPLDAIAKGVGMVHQHFMLVPNLSVAENVVLGIEPGPGQMYYTVQDGETLYGICFKLYQSVNHLDEICQLNGLTDQNHIMSGQKLVVPESSVPQEAAEN